MVKEPINPENNYQNFQNDIKLKSINPLFMYFQSNIIIGLYSYLQEYGDKDIEALFSDAINLFNALGSWIYGGTSPKIIYPVLQVFIKNANDSSTESFSHLLNYINWMGNNLYKNLEDNQWIEEHYYESFTIRKSNEITTGLFFMWRIGWLIVSMKDISKEKKVPNLLQPLKTLDTLFDAFGGWIFNQEGLTNITQSFQEFEKIFEMEFPPIYDEVLEETNKTRNNIAKFLQKL
jgi:hypothetical protein